MSAQATVGALSDDENEGEAAVETTASLEPAAEQAPKTSGSGKVRCRVVDCALLCSGRLYQVGDEGDFTAEEIASVKVLEPIEE